MWMPTHIQLTVQRARDLLTKGKHGTNDCFVVMSLGKEKFQTSIKEKAGSSVEWREECELTIPGQGNTAQVKLQVLHRNFLGVDEFLGQTTIALADFDVYERPRSRWYQLHSKPDKKDTKARGELEVRVGFTVKAASSSTADLSHKGSLLSLPKMGSLGGSMASLGKKKKSIGKLAASVGNKVAKVGRSRPRGGGGGSSRGSEAGSDVASDLGSVTGWDDTASSNADPGVISEGDEDEFGFDDEQRGRRARSPEPPRRPPRPLALEEETPLSSLASSVQSGLSDAPAAPPGGGEAQREPTTPGVPSPLATVHAARDQLQLSRSARTGSTRSADASLGPATTAGGGGGGSARSSGRYRPTGVAASPPDSGAIPEDAAALDDVADEEDGLTMTAPAGRHQPDGERGGRPLSGNPFDDAPTPQPRRPDGGRVGAPPMQEVHPSREREDEGVRLQHERQAGNPFQSAEDSPSRPAETNKSKFDNGEGGSPARGKLSTDKPAKRSGADLRSTEEAATEAFEGTKTVATKVNKPDPEKVGVHPAKRSVPADSGESNPFAEPANPFEVEPVNPFDDDAQNPFANEADGAAEEEDMYQSSGGGRGPPRSAPTEPPPPATTQLDREKKRRRDKFEKMMKKTPQLLKNLAGKKDGEDMVKSPEKAQPRGLTPSASLSLLPLSADVAAPSSRRVVEGGNDSPASSGSGAVAADTLRQYDGTSRHRLIEMVVDLQQQMQRSRDELKRARAQAKDLEEYVDTLLVRVMEAHPELLQTPPGAGGGPARPAPAKYVGRGG